MNKERRIIQLANYLDVNYPQTKGLRIYGAYYKSYGRHRDEHSHNAAKQRQLNI